MTDKNSPAPHGAGGLKSPGSWFCPPGFPGPAPHGAGGLKSHRDGRAGPAGQGPAPHGAGGLKFSSSRIKRCAMVVPPRTGRVD